MDTTDEATINIIQLKYVPGRGESGNGRKTLVFSRAEEYFAEEATTNLREKVIRQENLIKNTKRGGGKAEGRETHCRQLFKVPFIPPKNRHPPPVYNCKSINLLPKAEDGEER